MWKKLCFVFLFFFLCAGCKSAAVQATPPPELTYASESVAYSEGVIYSFQKEMNRGESDRAVYFFEPSVESNQRQACVGATEQLLSMLGEQATKPEIVIFRESTYQGINLEGNRLYTTVRDWNSVDYAADVLLAVGGAGSHYGLAYGYAGLLCQRLGWGEPCQEAFTSPSVPEVRDLNLLCFDTDFVSEEDAEAARQLACDFAAYYAETYGEAELIGLLLDSDTGEGMDALTEALSVYYRSQDVEYMPSPLRFGYGGVSYEYCLKSEYASFWVSPDWVDQSRDYHPVIPENFLHENYAETREFFEINLQQMKAYQELFALPDYDNDLSVLFIKPPRVYSPTYATGLHSIFLTSVVSLSHEYIHALTRPAGDLELWEYEGFARYFDHWYDHYGLPFLNVDYNSYEDEDEYGYLIEYKEKQGRPIDMAVDYGEIENLVTYYWDWDSPNINYETGASFVQYLVKQYGVERVVQHLYGDRAPLPKSHAALVEEWNQYIEETYQDYRKRT